MDLFGGSRLVGARRGSSGQPQRSKCWHCRRGGRGVYRLIMLRPLFMFSFSFCL